MKLNVLALIGSLRKGSFNRMTYNAALELKPDDMNIEEFDIAAIPPYNEDVREQGFPPVVENLREKIRAADALLFITPEYNFSVPGVLKNAIDWASRPPDQPFDDKPAAIMGASPSILGTGRAQYHLRQSCVFLNMHLLNKPEILITFAGKKFDEAGKLTDETTREFIAQLLANLAAWTRRLANR